MVVGSEVFDTTVAPPVAFVAVRSALAECEAVALIAHPELRGGYIEVGLAVAAGIPVLAFTLGDRAVPTTLTACATAVRSTSADQVGHELVRELAELRARQASRIA